MTPRWWRDAVGAACWGSGLVVVYLWLADGGARGLTSSRAEAVTSLSRVVGLLAADLLLVQVLLMARVPWVERSYGQDELARRHRLVGFWSVSLVAAHVVLVVVGYGLADRRPWLLEAWHVVTTYPGMTMASLAVLALVGVAATSVRRARRSMRYERWHLLHLYAYAGVGLALPHQLWTGADFVRSPAARAYWVSAYVLAAGAVVVFRVAAPLWRSVRHDLHVTRVERPAAGVVSVRVGGRHLERLGARPGQFFVWRFLDGDGWLSGHPFSLSAAPNGELRLTAKAVGDGTGRLAKVPRGTRVVVEGPYGRLTAEHRVTDRAVLLACGIGITPLRALLEDLAGVPTTLVYRARNHGQLVLREEIEQLAAQHGTRVHYLLGRRRPGSWLPAGVGPRSDADVLLEVAPDVARSDVYVCGPPDWMDAVKAATRAAGVPRGQLHEERFAW